MRQRPIAKLAAALLLLASAGCGEGATESQSVGASLAKSPTERAAMEIAGARELERLRKPKKAIEAYERIVREFPESPQARIATERLGALKGAKGTRPSKTAF